MIRITSRVKAILEEIISNPEYITIKYIGEKLDVSSRTVLREMDLVDDWFTKNGFALIRKPSAGVKISATEKQRENLLEKLEREDLLGGYSPIDRQRLILFRLLTSKEPIKTYLFTHEFDVTEGTISKDLDLMEEWITKHKLKLVRKPGLGIYIDGKEKEIRHALANLLYQSTDESQLYQFIIDKKVEIRKGRVINDFVDLIEKDIIEKVQEVIDTLAGQLEERLTDSAYMGLLIHLSIAIQRIRNNDEIKMENSVLEELKTAPEFMSAMEIAKAIEEKMNIKIPEDEVGYLTMHLKGQRLGLF